jgi:hypothetical protein
MRDWAVEKTEGFGIRGWRGARRTVTKMAYGIRIMNKSLRA